MPKSTKSHRKVKQQNPQFHLNYFKYLFVRYWRASIWHKIWVILSVLVILAVSSMYGIARWYIDKHADQPLEFGATFIPAYAQYYGLEPQKTLDAIINDLGIKNLRLVSYWNEGEPHPGTYDFSSLDWQFDMAEKYGAKVSLSIGLRQPRWPECHMPAWAAQLPKDRWAPQLKIYMAKVINRYRDRPSLVSYQLENEYFLKVFGVCPDHSRERLIDEYNFVKALDPSKPLIITRSDNALPSWPVGDPKGDLTGASVYKRVWDKTVTKRYFEYPLPAWYYAFLAGGAELTTGMDTYIHELQAEAWLPEGYDMRTAPLEEVYKSMNPEMLEERIQYGVDTGMRRIDLWGVEWWYYMKEKRGVPGLWEAGKQKILEASEDNLSFTRKN